MAKDKCVTPESNRPKKNKSLSDNQVVIEEMETKVKKKRKNMEVEVSNIKLIKENNNLFIYFSLILLTKDHKINLFVLFYFAGIPNCNKPRS